MAGCVCQIERLVPLVPSQLTTGFLWPPVAPPSQASRQNKEFSRCHFPETPTSWSHFTNLSLSSTNTPGGTSSTGPAAVSLQDQRWQSIGLPAANDFTFSRQELLKTRSGRLAGVGQMGR